MERTIDDLCEKKRGIYSIAPNSGWNDQQLTKNCGIVPYLFYKKYGYRAVMVGTRLQESYPSLERYVKGVEMDFLADASLKSEYSYLDTHYQDMDVLVLHGLFPFYFPILHRYRQLRPDGKVYLELDPNVYYEDMLEWTHPAFLRFFQECDVIGASCHRMQKYLGQKWPCVVEYLPNGFYNFDHLDMQVDFTKKENIILTVGRIGSAQKRNEELLEAFAKVYERLPGWSVRLVGKVEPSFYHWIKDFYQRYPRISYQITLTGPIFEKKELINEYKRAKIFALTSVLEGGTPNVVAEALFCGCYMITSDIDASDDVIDNGRCGQKYECGDIEALAEILYHSCVGAERLLQGGRRSIAYAQEEYDFEKIIQRLYWLLFKEKR